MAKTKKKISDKVINKKSDAKKSLNPFEVHFNKQKNHILGQKLKNDRGLPGVSRAKALQKRKHTLLPEYNVKHKSNRFLDRRIGEKNISMTAEERTMARFTAERMKHHNKKSIFNLADDEILTHRGQTLNEIEKFDDPRSDDDDDEDDEGRKKSGRLEDSFVGEAHFGGGILTRTGKEGAKSHKDLIEQLISESKKRKAEKQKTKEHTLELTEKLDSEWKDLLPIVNKIKKTLDDQPEIRQKQDDYDKVMRELKFEARGHPSDRLKSEDEIAKEEKERLEKLEQDRLDRMRGITEKNPDSRKHRSADDLDDDFCFDSDPEITIAYDEEGKLKNGFEQLKPEESADENEDDDAEEENSEEDSDDDLSDLKNDESDSDLEELKETTEVIESEKERKRKLLDEKLNKSETLESKNVLKIERKRKLSEEKSETLESERVLKIGETKKERKITSDEKSETLESEKVLKIGESKKERKRKLSEEIYKTLESESVLKIGESKKERKRTLSNDKNIENPNNEIEIVETKKERIRKLSENQNIEKLKPEAEKLEQSTTDTVNNCELEPEMNPVQREIMEKAKKELPYTYSLPDSYETLQTLLCNHPPEYQTVIIERMITCNHPSLAAENKENLSRLFVYLLQHLNDSAPDQTDNDIESMQLCFSVLNSLTPHFYTLTQMHPVNACKSMIEVIKEKQNEYKMKHKHFPGIEVLIFLKLISCLFSTSDFRHQVVTPSLVFISQMLTNCRVRSRYDISYGLFLVTLFAEYTTLSKRYMPAAIIYLMGIVHMSVPKLGVKLVKIIPPFKPNSAGLVLNTAHKKSNFELKMSAEDFVEDKLIDEQFKLRSFYTVLKLAEELHENWANLSSQIAIFEPLFNLLELIPGENYPNEIQEQLEKLKTTIQDNKLNKKIEFIMYEKKKPKALRLYEPNIQKVYDCKRHKPMSKERAEREKLLHKYKKEMKGAVREIRRDKSFLGRVKIKQQIQSDVERKEKVRQIYSEASIQQGELNAMDRKKKRQ